MRCKTVSRLIDDHVDGLLPAGKAERVRAHLERCEACHADSEAARAASTSLAAWGDLEPPSGCFDAILESIEHLPPEALDRGPRRPAGLLLSGRTVQWLATGGLAAAAAVMAGVGLEMSREAPVRRVVRPVEGLSVSVDPHRPTVDPFDRFTAPPAPVFAVPGVVAEPVMESGLRKRRVFVEDAEPVLRPDDAAGDDGPR